MTFFLPERSPEVQAETDAVFSGQMPSFGEIRRAQAEFDRIDRDLRNRALRDEGEFVQGIEDRLGEEFAPGEAPDPRSTPLERSFDHIFDAVRRAQEARPDEFGDLPTDFETFQKQNIERRAADFGEVQHVLDSAPPGSMAAIASLTGSLEAAVTDPETLALALFGGNPAAGVLRFAAAEGGLAALDEARTLPDQFARQRELGGPEPRPGQQVALAFGAGAALGGIVGGAARFIETRKTRDLATGERRPADQGQLQFARDVDDAQATMEAGGDFPTGREEQRRDQTGTARPEPGTLGALTGPRMGDFDFSPSGNASPQTNRIGYVVGKLLALGYEPHHALGLTANLMQESGPGLNTRAVGDGGNAFGMAQWNGPRRRQYLDFAQRKGRDPGDLDTQIEFLDWEMKNTERGAAAKILNTDTARDAAIVASNEFWRPGIPHLRRRAAFADSLAEQFEAGQVPKWQGARSPSQGGAGDFTGFDTSRGFTGTGQVTAGDDIRVDVEYQVVDASDLVRASGDLQPRDRSRVASDEQISEIAATLDPARLMPSPEADRGAPIVGPDNVIESGNGRVMAIQRAFERNPDRADAYRQQIEGAGFEIPAGVQTPVLIGRRTSELDEAQRQAFVRRANTSAVARMSATERAASDARAIDSDTLAQFVPDQPIGSTGNVPFTRRFLNSLPQAERSGLVDATGALNAEGITRVRQALFARAFGAPDILARFAEADTGEFRSLIDALERAAPDWAGLRSAVAEGRVLPEFDITDFVLDAMRLIATAREVAGREGSTTARIIDEMIENIDLLEGATAPLTAALVRKFTAGGRAASADKIADFLRRYAAEAQKVGGTGGSLLDDVPGPLDVLKTLDRATFGSLTETGSTRVPNEPRPLPEIEAEAIPEAAFADGASSPEAIEADDLAEAQLRGEVEPAPERLSDMGLAEAAQLQADLKAAQAIRDVDDLMERGARNHEVLTREIETAAREAGVTARAAPLKSRARVEQKIADKYGGNITKATDVARGGVDAPTPEAAEAFVSNLARRFRVIDEGYNTTAEGYLDRKLLVVFDDGQLGEVQIWPPGMFRAKEDLGGHVMYEEFRLPETAPARKEELRLQMNALYSRVTSALDGSWSRFGGGDAPTAASTVSISSGDTSRARSSARTSRAVASEGTDQASPVQTDATLRTSDAAAISAPSNRTIFMGDTSGRNIGAQGRTVNTDSPEIVDITRADIRAQVAALTEGEANVTLDLEDGTSVTTREILADLDADQNLMDVIDACNVGGRA